jgi:hypothetical protein
MAGGARDSRITKATRAACSIASATRAPAVRVGSVHGPDDLAQVIDARRNGATVAGSANAAERQRIIDGVENAAAIQERMGSDMRVAVAIISDDFSV